MNNGCAGLWQFPLLLEKNIKKDISFERFLALNNIPLLQSPPNLPIGGGLHYGRTKITHITGIPEEIDQMRQDMRIEIKKLKETMQHENL